MNISSLLEEKITGEWGADPDGVNDVFIIRTANFTNIGVVDFSKLVKRSIPKNIIQRKKLCPGDIIIEKSGGSPLQPVGRVVYFNQTSNAYLCNNFTTVLRPKKSVNSKYLFYDLFYRYKTGHTKRYQNKTTGILNLKLDRYLKEEEIVIPSLEEQEKIVESLDSATSIGLKRLETLSLAEQLLTDIFISMFGDPKSNDRHWGKMPINKIGKVTTGNTPSRRNPENYGNYIEWIKSDNIPGDYPFLTTASEYLSESGAKSGRVIPPGSLLTVCIAGSKKSIGRTAITNHEVSFNQQINAITPYYSTNTYFLYYLLKLGQELVQAASTNGMKGIVTKGVFENIELISPPKKLQDEFGDKFLSIYKTKQKQLKSAELLRNYSESMMQKYFSQN